MTKKTVIFSNNIVISFIEPHTSYSTIERRNTWYSSEEKSRNKKTVDVAKFLAERKKTDQAVIESGNKHLLDDIKSVKYCGLDRKVADEITFAIEMCLEMQENLIIKNPDTINANADKLSHAYSTLPIVTNHKNIARNHAIYAAEIAKEIYIKDGFETAKEIYLKDEQLPLIFEEEKRKKFKEIDIKNERKSRCCLGTFFSTKFQVSMCSVNYHKAE